MEETITILHVSDTHLGYRQYGIHPREDDLYRVFGEVVDIAVRERVDLVVHSGDFFDSTRPPPQAIRVALRELKRLRDAGIPVVAVLGDHDTPRRRIAPPLLIPADLGLVTLIGVRGAERRSLRTRGGLEAHVAGRGNVKGPGARSRLLSELQHLQARGFDAPSILVLHQALREAAPFEYELELAELPQGYSYYALGHIHLHRAWKMGESMAAYPGSIDALRRDEARQQDKRFVLLVEVGRRGVKGFERIELRTVRPQPYLEHSYRSENEFRAWLASVRSRLASYKMEPLVHIVVHRVPSNVKRRIRELIDSALADVALAYRVDIVEEDVAGITGVGDVREVARLDIGDALRELLGDTELAELALRLIDTLGIEGVKRDSIEEAKRIIDSYYGIEG